MSKIVAERASVAKVVNLEELLAEASQSANKQSQKSWSHPQVKMK